MHGSVEMNNSDLEAVEFHCGDCVNDCDVMLLVKDAEPVACLSDRCGKWSEDPGAAGERGSHTGCDG